MTDNIEKLLRSDASTIKPDQIWKQNARADFLARLDEKSDNGLLARVNSFFLGSKLQFALSCAIAVALVVTAVLGFNLAGKQPAGQTVLPTAAADPSKAPSELKLDAEQAITAAEGVINANQGKIDVSEARLELAAAKTALEQEDFNTALRFADDASNRVKVLLAGGTVAPFDPKTAPAVKGTAVHASEDGEPGSTTAPTGPATTGTGIANVDPEEEKNEEYNNNSLRPERP